MAVTYYLGLTLASALALYTIYGAIYRLFLSPLSKFPGPKLAALTQWYEFYFNCIKDGQFIWEIKRMHKIYGPIVRINPFELHIDDPDFYDELYAGSAKKRDKYLWFTQGAGSPQSSFETIHHNHHRLRRSAISHFFSKRSIVSTTPLITSKIANLCSLIRSYQATQRPLNLRVAFCSLTLDIISDVCFGKNFGLLEDEKLGTEWSNILQVVFESVSMVTHFPILMTIINLLPDRWAGPVMRHHRNTRTLVGRILRHEDDDDPEHRSDTIFHTLRDSDLPLEEKTLGRLADEGNILIGAGSETTASILAILFYHLTANPPMWKTLRDEVSSVKDELTWLELEKLPFLTAVINEALRISSSVSTRLPRIDPVEEIQFQKWQIPPGTPVSMSYYFIHYNTEIFPSPLTFNPYRWLPNPDVPAPYRLENYLVPFSKGSRMCIGLNLAYAELYLTTATLVKEFEFDHFETNRSDVDISRDGFVGRPIKGSKGIRVLVRR